MTRYTFSLHPKVKGYVEWQLEHYREDKKQLEELKRDMIPSATQTFSPTGGVMGGGTSSPTEDAAIRIATNPYILALERNIRAIETVLAKCDKTELQLIELVYWRRSHTIEGAGMRANVSRRTAYRKINRVIYLIALEMGIINL